MEATREIYWNVGHGVILPMYFFAFIAIAVFLYGFYRRVATYKLGKMLYRLDRLPERIFLLLKNAFAQLQVLRVFGPGSLHALFFWGFCLLFIGTLLIMAQVDFTQPIFDLTFLKGTFYKLFSLVLDVAGLVALVMLGGLLVRRFFVKPEGLETILDDYVVHALLFAILLTGFVVEGLRIADTELMTNPGLTLFSPVGTFFGKIFFLGMTADALSRAHTILWWVHFFLSMGFIVIIPFTKLRHIFTTSANYLFTDLSPKGSISTINLEDEGSKQFGAAKVSDLAWKDIFDADACTTCKRCQERCPAYATGKPLSPMKVVKQIGEVAFTNTQGSLIETITGEVLWECTTCLACQHICPANIEHVNKILEMRRNLSLMQGAFPGDEVRTAVNDIEINGNPFGLPYAARGEWTNGLDVKIMDQDSNVDILYFVGCYASFDKRNRDVARSFIKICNAAGVKVGILGKEGKMLRRAAKEAGQRVSLPDGSHREHRADQGLRRQKDRHDVPPLFQHAGERLQRPWDGCQCRALQHLYQRADRQQQTQHKTFNLRFHLSRLLLPGTLHGYHLRAARRADGGRRQDHGDGKVRVCELLLRGGRRPDPCGREAGNEDQRGTGNHGPVDQGADSCLELSLLPHHVRGWDKDQ